MSGPNKKIYSSSMIYKKCVPLHKVQFSMMRKYLVALPVVLLMVSGAWAQGLKDAYKDYFRMGVALSGRNMTPEQEDIITREFNSVTCENAMKPGSLQPAEGRWNWREADRIANFCREHGIKMRGHCLVWHNQFADWMFYDAQGKPVDKKLFYKRLKKHIRTVVKRYKDVVYCWDVVNEAIADGLGDTPFRKSKLYELCGDEFILKAFKFARQADPKALLFYNDYNEVKPHKCERICQMILDMKKRGAPIDGIGMQGHYNIHYPAMNELSDAIEKYARVVDHIQITELDVRANMQHGGDLNVDKKGEAITPEVKSKFEQQYVNLFRTLRQHSDKIEVVTFWNLTDRDSWLGADNYPLLFDKNRQPKEAYHKVLNLE